MCNCATRQAYVRVHKHNYCVRFCAREKITRSKFDLLFEVIFKDLAVPAVSVKLALGSWFVLAVVMFYLWPTFTYTGIRRQVM